MCSDFVLRIYGGNLSSIKVRMFLWRLAGSCGGWLSDGRGGVSGRFLGRSLRITHWILSKTILEPPRTDGDDPVIKSRDARDFTLRRTLSNWNLTELLVDSSQAWIGLGDFRMNNLSFIAYKQKLKQSKKVKLHFVKFPKIVFVR